MCAHMHAAKDCEYGCRHDRARRTPRCCNTPRPSTCEQRRYGIVRASTRLNCGNNLVHASDHARYKNMLTQTMNICAMLMAVRDAAELCEHLESFLGPRTPRDT